MVGQGSADIALLRSLSAWTAWTARRVLPAWSADFPCDERPAAALTALEQFVDGEPRRHRLRQLSMDAHRAGVAARGPAAAAARAIALAASTPYLHLDLLHTGHQHPHLLGPAAHAELARPGELELAVRRAPDEVIAVAARMPLPQAGRSPLQALQARAATLLRERRTR